MEKAFKGLVDDKGNLKIHSMKDFKRFLGEQKSRDVIICLKFEEVGASSFSKNYFLHLICLEFVKIFKEHYGEVTTKEVVSERLRSWCAVCREGDEIKELDELSQIEMNELIRNSKFIANREFDYHISD